MVSSIDPTSLIDLYVRAHVLSRREGQTDWGQVAEALCEFFGALLGDDQFWATVVTAADESPDAGVLLASFGEFEREEVELLVRSGLSETQAVEITTQLSSALHYYQAGARLDLQHVRDLTEILHRQVCSGDVDYDRPERMRDFKRVAVRALAVAGVLVSAAATPTPLGILAALLQVVALTAGIA